VYNIRTALSQFFLANVQLEAVRGVNSIDSNRSRREIIKHLSPSIKKETPVKAGNEFRPQWSTKKKLSRLWRLTKRKIPIRSLLLVCSTLF
jgi:hypothetical protein